MGEQNNLNNEKVTIKGEQKVLELPLLELVLMLSRKIIVLEATQKVMSDKYLQMLKVTTKRTENENNLVKVISDLNNEIENEKTKIINEIIQQHG